MQISTLTITPSGNGTGAVTSTPAGIDCGMDCDQTFADGDAVTLHAAPGNDSTFVGWSGGGCQGTGDCTISVAGDLTIQAAFALDSSAVVTLAGDGVGTVTSSPPGINCPTDCSEAYAPGQTLTLTASAGARSTFAGWSGGGCTGTGSCSVSTDMATGVVATFTRDRSTLTVAPSGNGTGAVTSTPAGIDCGTDCDQTFADGDAVTLHAAPGSDSTFVGWSGAGCQGTGDCTLNVAGDLTIQAAFALDNSAVVTLAGDGVGTVTSSPPGINCPTDCSEAYAPGQTLTLTASAGARSTFAGWSGGSCTGTGPCSVSTDMATGVVATFTRDRSTLTVARAGNGLGDVTSDLAGINCGATCSASYESGSTVTLVAVASAGSTFSGWAGGGCSGTGACDVALTVATTVTATFTLNRYLLTVSKGGDGSGTIASNPTGIDCGTTCSAPYNYGTTVVLIATPSSVSSFSGWVGGGCSGTGTCSTAMTEATNVTAMFDPACTTVSDAIACIPDFSVPDISTPGLPDGKTCHDRCQVLMSQAGMSSGCWVFAFDGNCYCRGGALNTGSGGRPGGACKFG